MKNPVAHYRGSLLSFFNRRTQSVWDAEELTQEVFCKILKNNDTPVDQYPESHLYTVAWSVLKDKSRHDRVRQRSQHIPFDENYAVADVITPEQTLKGEQRYHHFLAAVDHMSPKVRTVFLLSRYEGLTYSEIAEHCAVSISAVEKTHDESPD